VLKGIRGGRTEGCVSPGNLLAGNRFFGKKKSLKRGLLRWGKGNQALRMLVFGEHNRWAVATIDEVWTRSLIVLVLERSLRGANW